MKLTLKSGLLIIFAIVIVVFSGLYLFKPTGVIRPTGVSCGGWDTFGDVVCKCSGYLSKSVCPPDALCDSEIYTCHGVCSECKCYEGPASDGVEIPCKGREEYFKQ